MSYIIQRVITLTVIVSVFGIGGIHPAVGQTTQPTTQPSRESDLKASLESLQRMVAKLQTENRRLNDQLKSAISKADDLEAKLEKAFPQPTVTIEQAIRRNELVVGMTFDQACKALGSAMNGLINPWYPPKRIMDTGSAVTWEWDSVSHGIHHNFDNNPSSLNLTWTATFVDGKATVVGSK